MRNKRTFATEVVADPFEALRRAVYGRGALEASAEACGISHQLLSRQLNQEPEAGHLYLSRAMAIEKLLDSDALAEAFATRRDGVFVKLPKLFGVPGRELMENYTRLIGEFAEASRAIANAWADGEISTDELRRFQKELRDVYTAGEQLVRCAMEQTQRTPKLPATAMT